jgi:NADPH-dependent 7-cyano-7-deazaguanine reductase QueF-like protein
MGAIVCDMVCEGNSVWNADEISWLKSDNSPLCDHSARTGNLALDLFSSTMASILWSTSYSRIRGCLKNIDKYPSSYLTTLQNK